MLLDKRLDQFKETQALIQAGESVDAAIKKTGVGSYAYYKLASKQRKQSTKKTKRKITSKMQLVELPVSPAHEPEFTGIVFTGTLTQFRRFLIGVNHGS